MSVLQLLLDRVGATGVLALHAGDLLAIAAVLLVWAGLRRLSRRSRR